MIYIELLKKIPQNLFRRVNYAGVEIIDIAIRNSKNRVMIYNCNTFITKSYLTKLRRDIYRIIKKNSSLKIFFDVLIMRALKLSISRLEIQKIEPQFIII